ncbi:MAG: efflux RND transporter periplasmic adaptor subunit [Burkholderiales bacterium]|nr:efflux RND transporter periplasmic adaptor subunit [Burkholderiales bacterium]
MTLRTVLFLFVLAAAGGARAAAPAEHQCLIEPYRKIEIRSPVEALIDAVRVERGSVVKKGQVLVQLNARVEQAALASARYRAVMEGQVRTADARLNFAREKHRRRDELSRQNFTSAQDREEALAEMRVAEAELVEAKDNRELSSLEAKRLAELVHQRTLSSPFDGIVTDVLQHPGELAQTGENARPILKLAQLHPLRVEVVLPVALHASIKKGARAEVESEAPLRGRFKAAVHIVDKVVDSASGTFGVRLELPNPTGSIPAGVKCKVRFP